MEFSAKNRFHHATASVQSLLNDFTNISVISNLKKKQPSENESWGFANCIPRAVILHEVIQEDNRYFEVSEHFLRAYKKYNCRSTGERP